MSYIAEKASIRQMHINFPVVPDCRQRSTTSGILHSGMTSTGVGVGDIMLGDNYNVDYFAEKHPIMHLDVTFLSYPISAVFPLRCWHFDVMLSKIWWT